MRYFVRWEIEGQLGTHQAGPYDDREIAYQLRDISTYMNVVNARIVSEEECAKEPLAGFAVILPPAEECCTFDHSKVGEDGCLECGWGAP